ncbi:hypothetical protein C8F01DRAFT_1374704 [Mycena amicta]|nr:hypothetical protein C8F01DRAFT_1374704 [Mycena amicta]
MLSFIALLPILSVTVAAYQRPTSLNARTTIQDCTAPCEALATALSAAGGDAATLCTNDIVSKYAACYNCDAQVPNSGLDQQEGQADLDAYVQGCKAEGHPVNSVTLGGSTGTSGSTSGSSGSSGSGNTTTTGTPSSGKKGDAVSAHASKVMLGLGSALGLLSLMVL